MSSSLATGLLRPCKPLPPGPSYTDPRENLESVDTIVHRPLHVVHQIVRRASKHYGRDGAVFLLCQQTRPGQWGRRTPACARTHEHYPPCLKTTTCVSPTSERYTLSQCPISSTTGGVCKKGTAVTGTTAGPHSPSALSTTLTSLGSAVAPTVLHSLRRSHFEFSLKKQTNKKQAQEQKP